MNEKDEENVYLFFITESELNAITETIRNAQKWREEVNRLTLENENLRKLTSLMGSTINKLQGKEYP
ncbi:hypothetical protein ApAK_02940 [Thermoplasmatales archaeon AK]|nr:hypothetical protein [Thermoplasmatales archaeon AK]